MPPQTKVWEAFGETPNAATEIRLRKLRRDKLVALPLSARETMAKADDCKPIIQAFYQQYDQPHS
jgi:hypothetical protein